MENISITPSLNGEIGQSTTGVVGTIQVIVPLTGVVDIAALRSKLEKKLSKIDKNIQSLSARLNNQAFVANASPEVVQADKDVLAEAEKQAEILREKMQQLQ